MGLTVTRDQLLKDVEAKWTKMNSLDLEKHFDQLDFDRIILKFFGSRNKEVALTTNTAWLCLAGKSMATKISFLKYCAKQFTENGFIVRDHTNQRGDPSVVIELPHLDDVA